MITVLSLIKLDGIGCCVEYINPNKLGIKKCSTLYKVEHFFVRAKFLPLNDFDLMQQGW